MKKILLLLPAFFLVVSTCYAQAELEVKPQCPEGTITREITQEKCRIVKVPYYVHTQVCRTPTVRVRVVSTRCYRTPYYGGYYGRRVVWRRVCVPGRGCYRVRVVRRGGRRWGSAVRCYPVVSYRYVPGRRICSTKRIRKYRSKQVCDTFTTTKCIKKDTNTVVHEFQSSTPQTSTTPQTTTQSTQ